MPAWRVQSDEASGPPASVGAGKEVLNRAYGKSPQPLVGGETPIKVQEEPIDDRELARKIALILSRAAPKRKRSPGRKACDAKEIVRMWGCVLCRLKRMSLLENVVFVPWLCVDSGVSFSPAMSG